MENDGASWLKEREGATGATNYINLYIYIVYVGYYMSRIIYVLL